MNETLSIIAISTILIGWLYTIYLNTKKESRNIGALIQKVNDIDRRLGRIEAKIFNGE